MAKNISEVFLSDEEFYQLMFYFKWSQAKFKQLSYSLSIIAIFIGDIIFSAPIYKS